MMVGHLQRKKVSSNTQVMTAVLQRVQAPARNKRSRPWAITFEFNWTPRAPSGTEGFVERAMCSPFRLGDEKKIRGKSMKYGEWMRAALFLVG